MLAIYWVVSPNAQLRDEKQNKNIISLERTKVRLRRNVLTLQIKVCAWCGLVSPGAGGKAGGLSVGLSSSPTSRLSRNKWRLNPLWQLWRGTDAHAAEASLWSAARQAHTFTQTTHESGSMVKEAHIQHIYKEKQLFLLPLPQRRREVG